MHELSISRSLVELACAHAEGRPVIRLRVAVGKLSAVMPDALRFCFETVRRDTLLHDAALEIEEVAGLAQCAGCGQRFAMPLTGARCACGERQFRLLAGEELKIVELELQEEIN